MSFYGCNSGDIDSVEVMGMDDGFWGADPREEEETELTKACRAIIDDVSQYNKVHGANFTSHVIPCVKMIKEHTGLFLREAKDRFDAWRDRGYMGNV